ncbi:hypothetical protein THAOC_12750, partial [Thalassiosira oceanica]
KPAALSSLTGVQVPGQLQSAPLCLGCNPPGPPRRPSPQELVQDVTGAIGMDDHDDGAGGGGTPLARRAGAEEIREAPGSLGSACPNNFWRSTAAAVLSCLDPPFIETVENKQPTHDHELVTEPSKSIRLALWGLWGGLVRLVGSGLGLALLLASGWFIGLSIDPLNRNSIQQHLIMPSVPSSLEGHALEVHHLTLTMPFVAGGNLSRYANNTNDIQWEVENELQWKAEIEINDTDETPKEIEINDADKTPKEIEIIDADESLQEIEVDDCLPSLSSPSSLRTITKPTNDDANCYDTSSMPDDRVSEGDERMSASSTSLVDRVSEGDERVVELTCELTCTAYTADYSLLPTSTSTMAHDSEPEGDGNFFSSDSDGVYVPEGEVYYTTNGDRLADDDSQLPFGFVNAYGSLAIRGFADYLTIYLRNVMICDRDWLTFPYFGSLKG